MYLKLKKINKLISTIKALTIAKFFQGGVCAGYYNAKNFGDQLTPDILSFYKLKTFHAPIWRYAHVVAVGSILHMLPESYKGAILGSGLISDKEAKCFSNAKVYLVRGHLTRQLLDLRVDTPVGDPGLLADVIYKSEVRSVIPIYKLGIVPHYRDKKNSFVETIQEKYSNMICVIDVENTPRKVVRKIAMCKNIVSSSLHGLVVADSLGIPNNRIILSEKIIGGDFKYKDYYSCFNKNPNPITLKGNESLEDLLNQVTPVDPEKITDIKNNIKKAFFDFINDYKRDRNI